MAISAIFLMVFLLQHFLINITSVFSEDLFNMLSHFMGTNPLVQFVLQPVLIAGVIFHFVMGFYLEIQNRKASKYEYFKEKSGEIYDKRLKNISLRIIFTFPAEDKKLSKNGLVIPASKKSSVNLISNV